MFQIIFTFRSLSLSTSENVTTEAISSSALPATVTNNPLPLKLQASTGNLSLK